MTDYDPLALLAAAGNVGTFSAQRHLLRELVLGQLQNSSIRTQTSIKSLAHRTRIPEKLIRTSLNWLAARKYIKTQTGTPGEITIFINFKRLAAAGRPAKEAGSKQR